MDKCYIFTILVLVYRVTIVHSQPSYICQNDDGPNAAKIKNPDLSLKFTSGTTSDTMSTKQYLCNVTPTEPLHTMTCNEWDNSFPTSCSDADPEWLNKWSDWTVCAMYNGTGIMYRYRDITSVSGQTKCCLSPCIPLVDRQECTIHTGVLGSWSNWSECITSGEGYKHRSLKCHSNQSECLVPYNGSSFEISTCIPDSALSATGTEKNKELEKRYTLTEIILVALGCLLMGVLLTSLAFVLYMKRNQLGCFSKDIKDVRRDSKQQSAPDMQYLTESVAVKIYDTNNPKSKNENKAEETQYQLITSDQVGNDQQTYDELKVNEPPSALKGHQPNSSRLQHTGNDYLIDQTPNLQYNNQGVYEYCRDNDIDGHSYSVLEREHLSTELRTMDMGRPETNAVGSGVITDSTLGTEEKQSDAAHDYFVLEYIESGHNQD